MELDVTASETGRSTEGRLQRYGSKSLRRNTVYFAAARLASAGLSFAILVFVTGHLTLMEFGGYVLLQNFSRFVTGLSLLGLDWAAFRYLPQFYAAGHAAPMRRLLVTFVSLRAVVLVVLTAIMLAAALPLSALIGLPGSTNALRLYLLIFLADGVAEFVRTNVFAALVRQGYQLVSQVARGAVNLAILWAFALTTEGAISLTLVIESEIFAALAGVAVVLGQLVILDRQHGRELDHAASPPPELMPLLRFGFGQYANETIQLLGEGPTVAVVGAQFIGLRDFAVFGFARNLSQQIQRFLPAESFISLVWPKIIVSYSVSSSFQQLTRQTTLVMKLSNTALAVIVCIFVLYGREIAEIISKGKYGDAYGLLLFFMAWLFLHSQRLVVNVVASTVERVDLLRAAAIASAAATLPSALLLVHLGLGAFGLAAGLVLGLAVYVGLAWCRLWWSGYSIALDLPGHAKILAAGAGAVAIGVGINRLLPGGLIGLAIGMAAVGLIFMTGIRLLRPFHFGERAAIERFIGRSIPIL